VKQVDADVAMRVGLWLAHADHAARDRSYPTTIEQNRHYSEPPDVSAAHDHAVVFAIPLVN